MRKIVAIIMAVVMLTALPTLTLAQEPAKYNFASAQGSKHITVTPGAEGTGVIYFYNIDGNRITHITLEVSQAPDNWQVEIEPPLGEIKVEIGGRIVTVVENLHVKPSEVLSQEAEDVPSDMVCIPVANRGYALAKVAKIIVRVPETEQLGTKGEISISAVAEWLGQTGAAAIKQGRDFDFSVEVISETAGGEEKIIEEHGTAEAVTETTGGEEHVTAEAVAEIAGGEEKILEESGTAEVVSETARGEEKITEEAGTTVPGGFPSVIERWLPAIIAVAIVILGAVLISLLVRRRHE